MAWETLGASDQGLDVSAIGNRETSRRRPDPAALGYLRVIDRMPEEVRSALEKQLVSATS